MLTVPIGPLLLPLQHLFLFVGVLIAWAVGAAASRRGGQNPETMLFNLFLLGIVSARAAFVAIHWSDYANDWGRIIDIRDGGFQPWVGLLVAIAAGIAVAWRRPLLRRPLSWGATAGISFWLLTSLSLAIYQQGMQMPAATLRNLEGEEVQLADFTGRPVVINLWATWCPPCRREMPVLAAAQATHPDVAFLFVNQGEDAATVNDYLKVNALSMRNMLFDNGGQLSRHVGSRALPTTLFYDAQGNQLDVHLGELSKATLNHYLTGLTASPDNAPR